MISEETKQELIDAMAKASYERLYVPNIWGKWESIPEFVKLPYFREAESNFEAIRPILERELL